MDVELFEPMASGYNSSNNNSKELDSASEDGDCDVNQERINELILKTCS